MADNVMDWTGASGTPLILGKPALTDITATVSGIVERKPPRAWYIAFGVSTYATVSALFWYVGMLPDLATLRDRASTRAGTPRSSRRTLSRAPFSPASPWWSR